MPVVSGKGNRTRKTLSFFGVNFDLRPPYEVICDGPIIFQSLKNDLYLKQSLPKLLGAPAYPVVTECVVKELRRLGDGFSNAALFAKRAKRVPCVHDGKVDVAECLLSCLRNQSHTGAILATNDPEVSKKATRVPGIVIISIFNQKKLILQAPSLATINHVNRSQKTKLHSLSDPDRALVQEVKAAEESLRKDRVIRKKRKRAKGPNPLSIKKSKEIGEKKADGTPGATAILQTSPSDGKSQANNVPHVDTGSPDVASGESGRKRKRRRTTKPNIERDSGSVRPEKGSEETRLPQCGDQSLAPGPRNVKQQSKQIGKQQSVMEVAIADDMNQSVSKVSAQQEEGTSPLAARNKGIDEHQRIQQLSSPTPVREQSPAKNHETSLRKRSYSDSQHDQEKEGNKVSFNESMSNASGGTSASGQITEPLSHSSQDGVASKDDSRVPPLEHADMNDGNLIVMGGNEAEEKLSERDPHATPGSTRTKKHRKNRRRRPKKNTSE